MRDAVMRAADPIEWRVRRRTRLIAAAVTFAAAAVAATGAPAQTLAEPKPPPKTAAPAVREKAAAHAKTCAQYGAGFVAVPGTGTCVKIGGAVTVEVGR